MIIIRTAGVTLVFLWRAPFQDINLLNAIYPCRASAKKDFICTTDYLDDSVRRMIRKKVSGRSFRQNYYQGRYLI